MDYLRYATKQTSHFSLNQLNTQTRESRASVIENENLLQSAHASLMIGTRFRSKRGKLLASFLHGVKIFLDEQIECSFDSLIKSLLLKYLDALLCS